GVLRVVRDGVGLDEPRGTVVALDHIELGGVAPQDRREIVLGDVLERLVLAPPALDVFPLQPLVQHRKILLAESAKSERHAKRSASSPASDCESGDSAARTADSSCSGSRGPTTTAVTVGCASSQPIASVETSVPRRAAISANRSSAANVRSVRRCS